MTAAEGPSPLDRITVRQIVQAALEEDGANQDLTTAATVPSDQLGRGIVTAKSSGIIAGLQFAQETYYVVEPRVQWMPAVMDGAALALGATIAHVAGPLHAILRGERVALNFLQRLSGIATMTRDAVDSVAGTPATILDTRKTTPGLRLAERYAVRVGGGTNHRFNLSAGILIKDNHIAAVRARGETLADAVRAALAAAGPATAVEVEV
ncbi:MAG: carboxylating nicotinate-nucleotide diphosphorylase, partial [Dehalococcoidia bacterium]